MSWAFCFCASTVVNKLPINASHIFSNQVLNQSL